MLWRGGRLLPGHADGVNVGVDSPGDVYFLTSDGVDHVTEARFVVRFGAEEFRNDFCEEALEELQRLSVAECLVSSISCSFSLTHAIE